MITRTHILTHAIGLVGAVLFLYLSIPLPWLFGPMAACLVAALCGVKLAGIKPLNEAMRTILGVAVGASITVAFMHDLLSMWSTLILIPAIVFVIGIVGIPYLQRVWGYDWATSYYATMPGGLQDMLVFGEEAGGNVRALSLIHATRVLVIVIILPILLSTFWQADLTNPPGAPATEMSPLQIVIMIICGIAGWQIAKAFGMFGASILGPLILAAVASLLGILQTRPPAEAIFLAQFFIAVTIGVKYVGITVAEIKRDIAAGLGLCVLLLIVTLVFVGGVQALGLAPPMETLLALTPGGQAELVVLALIVGADVSFVVAHHILRIFLVILGAPVFAKLLRSKNH